MPETLKARQHSQSDKTSAVIPYSYGLLRAALTDYLVKTGFISEELCIRGEKALLRGVARATGKVWRPSQETAEEYLNRFATEHKVVLQPVYVANEYRPKPPARKPEKELSFTYRWLRFRDKIVHQRGNTCEQCKASGVHIARSMHVDHITPRAEAPERIFDPDNVRVLCPSCHSMKTNQDKAARGSKTAASVATETMHGSAT